MAPGHLHGNRLMAGHLQALLSWIGNHETLLMVLGALSLLTFVGTLLAVPLIVNRIPADYFTRPSRPPRRGQRHPLAVTGFLVAKNLLGLVLLAAGIAMLVLPGQGLLTMLIGLMLMNFPGKFRAERWLVSRPGIFRAINWIRRRGGRPPLKAPGRPAEARPDLY